MSHARGWLPLRLSRDRVPRCKLPSGARVHSAWRDLSWRRAEDINLTSKNAGGQNSPPAPLLLEFDVPVEVIPPGLVQKIRREQALGRHQIVLRRLERPAQRLEMVAVLARVARTASRHDVGPGRLAAVRTGHDVVERQFAAKVLVAAILAAEAIAEKQV